VKDLKSARTGFTGTFEFYTEKSYSLFYFIFSVAVVDLPELIYQWKEQSR